MGLNSTNRKNEPRSEFSPRVSKWELSTADTLISTLWDPEQSTQSRQAQTADLQNCELISDGVLGHWVCGNLLRSNRKLIQPHRFLTPWGSSQLAEGQGGISEVWGPGSSPYCVGQGWYCPHTFLKMNSAHAQHPMLFPVYQSVVAWCVCLKSLGLKGEGEGAVLF